MEKSNYNFCIDRPFRISTYQDDYIFLSLIFARIALSGFQSTEMLIFA